MRGPTTDHICDRCGHAKGLHGRARRKDHGRTRWACRACDCRFGGPFGGSLPTWAQRPRPPVRRRI